VEEVFGGSDAAAKVFGAQWARWRALMVVGRPGALMAAGNRGR
jgi:hypothetical protein